MIYIFVELSDQDKACVFTYVLKFGLFHMRG